MRRINPSLKLIFKEPLFWGYSFVFSGIFFLFIFFFSLFLQTKLSHIDYEELMENRENKELYLLEEIATQEEEVFDDQKQKYDAIIQDLRERIAQKERELSQNKSSSVLFFPPAFEQKMLWLDGVSAIKEIISSDIFQTKKMDFSLEYYFKKQIFRGKFTQNTIQLYGVEELTPEELVSVFIHELGHYFDITYLEKKVLFDISDVFYNISWLGTYILKPESQKQDFVSGYAMTNKYEDFAESFIYYVLYNEDFRFKTQWNPTLKEKYDFFGKYIFKNDEFKKTNFRMTGNIQDYYWDITKIEFSLQNFLEYLKKWL